MQELSPDTLLNLLEMYEVAIRELRATGDRDVSGLLLRLERHRANVIEALAAKQAEAVTSAREIATEFMSLQE